MINSDRNEILKHFDNNQKNLYTHFPEGHLLSDPKNAENFIMLVTYYRRNLHRFTEEYLGIKLHLFQKILLYLMGISRIIVAIASRCSAKSFIVGVYENDVSILYPNSECGVVASSLPQAEIILNKKIQEEVFNMSPTSKKEANLNKCRTSVGKSEIHYNNNSQIKSVALNRHSRGNRTTSNVGEEAREIDKEKYDKYVVPFTHQRTRPYMLLPEYRDNPLLIEEPTQIFLSSSISDTHWLYKEAKNAITDVLNGGDSCMIAFDYSIALKHNLKTVKDLQYAKSTTDPVTWMIEYENAVLRTNTKAFFSYDLVKENQTEHKAFYPRQAEDVINKKTNPFSIPKQKDEVRIIACDIAMVDRNGNDNSCYACLRLLPEGDSYSDTRNSQYRIKVPYLEAPKGFETRKQAIRIRQLYADFDADYIVLDVRNAGVSVLDSLCRTLYDDERCLEYPPIKCMNDDVLNRACTSQSAQPVIFAINASAALNSKIAVNFKGLLLEHRVDLLVSKDEGIEDLRKFSSEYDTTSDAERKLYFEKPYLETMLLFSELINLEYEKNDLGIIKIKERPSLTKDRYTAVSYGCYFASELSVELINNESNDIPISDTSFCVSTINF